jgi:hypothetical protein
MQNPIPWWAVPNTYTGELALDYEAWKKGRRS